MPQNNHNKLISDLLKKIDKESEQLRKLKLTIEMCSLNPETNVPQDKLKIMIPSLEKSIESSKNLLKYLVEQLKKTEGGIG